MKNRMIRPACGLALVCLLCFAAVPASGQSNYATLGGTVFDPQRQVVPGALVRVKAAGTGAARQVTTNEQGAFQLTALLPGEYELTVEAKGFAALSRTV
ncbi:MAG: carboxypeptidase-like regulatory domain-containing protein, partial [Pyrinomonadaceae bacterium]